MAKKEKLFDEMGEFTTDSELFPKFMALSKAIRDIMKDAERFGGFEDTPALAYEIIHHAWVTITECRVEKMMALREAKRKKEEAKRAKRKSR